MLMCKVLFKNLYSLGIDWKLICLELKCKNKLNLEL